MLRCEIIYKASCLAVIPVQRKGLDCVAVKVEYVPNLETPASMQKAFYVTDLKYSASPN